MNDIELTSVDVKSALTPLTDIEPRLKEEAVYVKTRYGNFFVTVQGDRKKTPFITFHDLGLNSATQFHGFFNFIDNEPVMDSFCVYNINALGQEEGAPALPINYPYPTCDQLGDSVLDIVQHFNIKECVCFGIGFGANILGRFALLHPDLVRGIILINCVSTKCGWIEWGYQKWSNWYLSSGQFTEFTKNYLLWHHFGYQSMEKKHDLTENYSRIFAKINPINLGLLITSYINRTDLGIQRKDYELEPRANKFNFKCEVLNVMGDDSPHDDDVIETNSRLDPTKSSFVKFADCGGMVLEEQPAKMAEALRHFLQGLGYVPHLSITRTSSLASDRAAMNKKLLLQHAAKNSSFSQSQSVEESEEQGSKNPVA